jgi:uncharacterized protein (TIGR00730 family)
VKKLAVFCGSSLGRDQEYTRAAIRLGKAMVQHGIGLVYGAGSTGLMGVLADTVLENGGEVIGVTPQMFMNRGVIHERLTSLQVVDDMHARKATIAGLVDGFIALPGGLGTFEEIFEMLAWGQLGIHCKPCAVLNVNGYFDRLAWMMDYAIEEGFISAAHRGLLWVEKDEEQLIARFVQKF